MPTGLFIILYYNIIIMTFNMGIQYFYSYPAALALVAAGKVDVKKLITHRFKIEETLKAFETAKTGAGGAIKVMISC